jgi:hypothetical protein
VSVCVACWTAGYGVVVLNFPRKAPLRPSDVPPVAHMGSGGGVAAAAAAAAAGAAVSVVGARAGMQAAAAPGTLPPVAEPRVLTRVTLDVPTMAQAGDLRATNEALKAFDIVAVIPGSEAVLEAVCKSGCVDLIALPAGGKLPFFVRRAHVSGASEGPCAPVGEHCKGGRKGGRCEPASGSALSRWASGGLCAPSPCPRAGLPFAG